MDDAPQNGGGMRSDGMPVGQPFKPGVAANPGGRPKQVRAYVEAIRNQETPERVCEVVDAMRTGAIAGGKTAPACARVYFEVVGVPLGAKDDDELAEKLKDAPPEFLAWVAKLAN